MLFGFVVATVLTVGLVLASAVTARNPYDLGRTMVVLSWTSGGLLSIAVFITLPTQVAVSDFMVGLAVVGGADGLLALVIWSYLNDREEHEVR